MKYLLFILVLCLGVSVAQESNAQCNVELYSQRSLKRVKGGYMFVKSFRINGKQGSRRKLEYTCVFSKDMSYQIHIAGADGKSDGIVGTLYNPERRKLASNFFEGEFFQSIRYDCKATGIYYLAFTFRESSNYCGAAILSFKRI